MKPNLKVVDGGRDDGWHLPKLTPARLGGTLVVLGAAGWLIVLSATRYQALFGGVTAWIAIIAGWHLIRGRLQRVEAEAGVQVVKHVHVHRRWLAVALLALPLLSAPQPARADISFTDLSDAFDDFGGKWIQGLMDSICAWLLFPAAGLPTLATLPPLPTPQLGGWPTDIPATPDDGIAAVNEMIVDQRARVAKVETIIDASAAATSANAAQLQVLSGLAMADPTSVAAVLQVVAQANIADATASATASQMVATEAAMRAAEIENKQHSREIDLEQHMAFVGYGRSYQIAPEYIDLTN
jgi:hypothetical protein